MSKRRPWRLVFVACVLGVLSFLVPGSPVYLPTLFGSARQYDGRSLRQWTAALNAADPAVRRQAVFALGAIGEDAGQAAPRLGQILTDDGEPEVRQQAALALAKMGAASKTAAPALAQALDDPEASVRMNAALALLRVKDDARCAVPALIKAVQDERNHIHADDFTITIQEMVALVLARVSAGSDEGVPALTAALDTASADQTRRALVRALGEVGSGARSALPRLRTLLQDNNSEMRDAVAEAIHKIDADAADGILLTATAPAPPEMQLPEAERSYIWEIEHHGNLLVKHGFGPLAQALKAADAAALTRALAVDFKGADLGDPDRVRSSAGHAEVERIQDAGHPPLQLNREQFLARLLEFRKFFGDTPPQVKFALVNLGPKVRGQVDGVWEGTTQLRLNGETTKGAPAEVVVMLRYEIPKPTQESLAQPGWLRAASVLQVLQAKAPQYLFAEVSKQRGLDTAKLHDNWSQRGFQPTPGGVYVCDFDRDGILDMLVTDVSGYALYKGRADGTFADVTSRVGLPREDPSVALIAAWIDIDGDGWPDLLMAGRVFRNEGGQRFTDYTDRCNLRLPRDTSSVAVADYDRDGKLDVYVTRNCKPGGKSWLEVRSGDSHGNYLFRNKGGWQFEDVTQASNTLGGYRSTFAAAWLDANNDGWPDLHVANEFGDGVLLINNHDGTFTEHLLSDHPADYGTMGLAVGDIDNDGNIDIYCANMYSKAGTRVIGNLAPDAYPPDVMEKIRRFVGGSQMHHNKGDLKFEQVGKQLQVNGVGWAYGACLADLDNDGFLDIYATAGFISRSRDEPDG
jgi:hypothetical protein